jgi:hypothetical protein
VSFLLASPSPEPDESPFPDKNDGRKDDAVFNIDDGDTDDCPPCFSTLGSPEWPFALLRMAALAVGSDPRRSEFLLALGTGGVGSDCSIGMLCFASSSNGSGSPCILARPSCPKGCCVTLSPGSTFESSVSVIGDVGGDSYDNANDIQSNIKIRISAVANPQTYLGGRHDRTSLQFFRHLGIRLYHKEGFSSLSDLHPDRSPVSILAGQVIRQRERDLCVMEDTQELSVLTQRATRQTRMAYPLLPGSQHLQLAEPDMKGRTAIHIFAILQSSDSNKSAYIST